MRTIDYTLPDGTAATASPADVAKAVENLLMDGTHEVLVRTREGRATEARHAAIIQAIVDRAIERGIATW